MVQNPLPPKKIKPKPKELTARDKALEFAKNVPKPVARKVPKSNYDERQASDFDDYSNAQVGEGAQEMNELAAKHEKYADELARIKEMLD